MRVYELMDDACMYVRTYVGMCVRMCLCMHVRTGWMSTGMLVQMDVSMYVGNEIIT